jgi:hypothetical protein
MEVRERRVGALSQAKFFFFLSSELSLSLPGLKETGKLYYF